MRYLFGCLCVCALGVMGCSETTGTGGSGGDGGQGGGGVAACEGNVCPCTEAGIRAAIAKGGGPFLFDCDGPTTVVTQDEIVINNDVKLDGKGNLTVDGGEDHRLFSVAEGVTTELRGFKVTRGAVVDESGGGVASDGTLTIRECVISNNRVDDTYSGDAATGGGIENGGTMAIIDSIVLDNYASLAPGDFGDAGGGGILNTGTVTLVNSTVSENVAGSAGGGISNRCGTLTLVNSTVSRNGAACECWGGGIYNGGTATILNSTVSGNRSGHVSIIRGGIENSGWMLLTNSTLSENDIRTSAVRGVCAHSGAYIEMAHTLIDGECTDYVSGGADLTRISNGYNIESPGNTCGFDQGTDEFDVTAEELNLGPLQDNGGDTMTHALGADSAAIDHIPAVDCEVDKDQRGQPRPETDGTMCDVGAFEAQP